MKILILSTSHPYKTAGVIVNDLSKELIKSGHTVKLIVKIFDKYHDDYISNYDSKFYYLSLKIYSKIKRKIFGKFNKLKTDPEYVVQTNNQVKALVNSKKILKKTGFIPDAILVLFAQRFLNFIDLYNIQQESKAPIFYIVPDMAPFTGLCHFSWECDGYKDSCGKCPAIYSNNDEDISRQNFNAKLKYLSKLDITPISVSNWLLEKINASALFKNLNTLKIPSNITRNDFAPVTPDLKSELRTKYGIDKNAFVISFGAMGLQYKRKGIDHIIRALNRIPLSLIIDKKVYVIISGPGALPEVLSIKNVISFGYLNWEELREFYQISNLFVSASIQDVGPGTIIEAIHCGVPVVSYNTGIADEWVISNETGYLVNTGNIEGLSEAIKNMINLSEFDYHELSANCLKLSKDRDQSASYFKNIEKIITDRIH